MSVPALLRLLGLCKSAAVRLASTDTRQGAHLQQPLRCTALSSPALAHSACRQAKRGGGGVVIQDEGLWRALTSVVHQVGADHPPPPLPPPLSSYDEFHSAGLGGGTGRAGVGRLLQAQAGTARAGAPLPHRGRRRVSTAAARQGGAEGGGSEPGSGSGSESPGGSIQSSSTTGASTGGGWRGCHCKKGCSHGRCGCKRAGQPCGLHCGCKGDCANRAVAAGGEAAAAAAAEVGLAEQNGPEGTDTRPVGTCAGQPAALPPPDVAAAAIGAAMERLAAASAAAAAVSALAPAAQQQRDEQAAAAAAAQHSEQAGPAADASSSMAAGSPSPLSSGAASQQLEQNGHEAAAERRCSCQKGCRDRRCPCRKEGWPCSGHCSCRGCTNCQVVASGTTTGGGGGGGAATKPDGCVVC